MGLSNKMTKFALAAVLAVGICPGVAFAVDQAEVSPDVQASGLTVNAASEIAYSGDTVAALKEDLTSEFGMLADREDPPSMKVSRSNGMVHISWSPSNKTVYKGFYLNADIADNATWLEDNFIATVEGGLYDFEISESYCGYAWPIAPVKASDATATTSSQYYLAVPAKDKIAEESSAVELAVTNNGTMTSIDKAELIDSNETLVLTMGSASFGKFFVGTQNEAAAGEPVDINAETNEFVVPIAGHVDGEPFVISLWSNRSEKWYERQFTIDAEAKTLVIDPAPEPAPIAEPAKMYRLYNPWTGEHFYTADKVEQSALLALGWNDEGIGWVAPTAGDPVYRLFNKWAPGGEHHYTMSIDERNMLIAEGWNDEGIGWYSDANKTVPLLREYNPNAFSCNHNYTTNQKEHDGLVELGWKDEGIAWYALQSADEAAAAEVDALIAAIQVQTRNANTDAQCKAARDAWDALTPEQKELVEEADYFALDTGDASKDDPLNADNIGDKEILVVSFGTSFNDSRAATIGAVEKAIAAANPDWSVRRAFTAQIIINHIQARDGEAIDNMDQAMDRAVANGVKTMIVAPTHLMHGAEYDELVAALKPYEDKINIIVAEPLLGQVGADTAEVNTDKETVAKAAVAAAVADAGYATREAAEADGVAFVFMGHGTAHEANITYDQMQSQMKDLGYNNAFIGTVEGEPEDTECSAVIEKVKQAGYKKVILRPLMVVAGDHANNDMADPEDPESWISQFTAAGAFDSVTCQINGLGEIAEIQQLYVSHVADAMK